MIEMTVDSTIQRRLLVNYRIDPSVVARLLPAPLRPQIVRDHAVGGVCFIRLGDLRPARTPSFLGLTTENVAHRFAVEWDGSEVTEVGVYVPRRDSDSWLTVGGGGRIFPGRHHLARFDVSESDSTIRLNVSASDKRLALSVEAHSADAVGGALFSSLTDAIDFFRRGTLGLSPHRGDLKGVRLDCQRWQAAPMEIDRMSSSLFDDPLQFPEGSIELDCALLMTDLSARWTPEEPHLPAFTAAPSHHEFRTQAA